MTVQRFVSDRSNRMCQSTHGQEVDMTLAMAVQFGPFRLFPTKRLLLRDGDAVCLTPKAFDTLVLLIEQRDRVVSKRELLDELWPSTAVEDATLSQHVFMLRRALADSEGPDVEYIATVQRRGYRFVAPVTEIDCVKDGKADAAAGASADAAHDRLRLFSATKRRHARMVVAILVAGVGVVAGM